jgi:hypothetical protein
MNKMVGNEQKVMGQQNFYEIMDGLQPTMKVHERTEDIVTRVAEVIRKCGFLVKYDSQTAPMIDAAVLRHNYNDEVVPMTEEQLDELEQDEWIILYNSLCEPLSLAELKDEDACPVEFLCYAECVRMAEQNLNDLLRFSWFDHERYFLFVGAAFSIVKAEHPDWIYETFIECFRKDVVDLMAERAEDYMGYKAFADEKG